MTPPARSASASLALPRVALLEIDPDLGRRAADVLSAAGAEVAARAGDPDALAAGNWSVVVVAGDMGTVRTAAVIRALSRPGATRVLVLRTSTDGHVARRCLEAGADGLLEAGALEAGLPAAVAAVAAGLVTVPQTIRRALAPIALTHRERQVLALVVEGCSNAEIGRRLYLSESTVKSHLATAFAKLGVRSRRDAAALILSGDAAAAGVLSGARGESEPPEGRPRRFSSGPEGSQGD